MKISYKSKKLEKTFVTDKGLAKTYGTLAKKVKRRRQQLESAENLQVIAQIPQLRLHPYHGKEEGLWSIDIQENWRILFEINQNPTPTLKDGSVNLKEVTIICIEKVTDPH